VNVSINGLFVHEMIKIVLIRSIKGRNLPGQSEF
jgi:hypothetical protein